LITDEELKQLGIVKTGHRKRILYWIDMQHPGGGVRESRGDFGPPGLREKLEKERIDREREREKESRGEKGDGSTSSSPVHSSPLSSPHGPSALLSSSLPSFPLQAERVYTPSPVPASPAPSTTLQTVAASLSSSASSIPAGATGSLGKKSGQKGKEADGMD
jgi:SAM domain (Sterile alpha motif)